MRNRRAKKGFTLVELIVVIAIIGILAAVLIPTFTGAIESARIAGGTSNARNLSTLLMTEAAYDNTAYLPTDRVWEIAEENNISLESEVGHYSYWYDASTNRVTYAETASMLSGAVDLNAARAAGSYSVEPETLVDGQPQYRYIERSDNPINRVLNVIRGVDGSRVAAEVDQAIDAAIEELSGYPDSLTTHFQDFKTDNCVYFTANGVIKGSGTEFEYAVVPFNTATLPTQTAALNIKITNGIVVPASVSIIDNNAFWGVTADVTVTATVIVEGETGLIGNLDQTASAGNVINITGEDVYNYLDINFKDSTDNAPGGTWVYYDKNGIPMDTTEKTHEQLLAACGYAYKMPAVTLKGGENGSFFDRVEKLTVRSKLVSGGIEFVMVAVDSSYNVYKLSGVGIVTEVGVSYPDYTKRLALDENGNPLVEEGNEVEEKVTWKNYQEENKRRIKLNISEQVSGFSNLEDCKITLSYKTGVAQYETSINSGIPVYASIYRAGAASFGEQIYQTEPVLLKNANAGLVITFNDSENSHTEDYKFNLTEMKATKIEVTSGDILIYVRNYES